MARRLLLVGCSICLAAAAVAEEEPTPDGEFLEYLGMWEESDEEWLLHDAMAQAAEKRRERSQERSDPAPEGEASPEKDDES